MRILSLITLLLFIGCIQKKAPVIKKQYGPLCGLFNSSPALMLCIEYSKGTSLSSVDTSCANERTHYVSDGASSYAITEAGTIYCDTDGVVGKCVLSNRTISYYSSEFTSGQAQSDCTWHGGTYH